MRAAVVRDSDDLVVNVIAVKDLSFPVASGHTLRAALNAGPGRTWNGTSFDPPPSPPPPATNAERAEAKIIASNAWQGLIRVLIDPAFTFSNKTEQQVIDAIKAKL